MALRKNLYNDLHSLQKDLDDWLVYYNNERTYQGIGVLWPNAYVNITRWQNCLERKISRLNLT